MISIVHDTPYRFVPPYPGRFWASCLMRILPYLVNRDWGITQFEFRGAEHLEDSLEAGHGILLAPTHARPCDPILMGLLSRRVGRLFYCMASRHLFLQGRFKAWFLQRTGVFSVFREGLDRESVKAATRILVEADRPLVICPEGIVTRTNDRLGTLQDGTAFIARAAARQRAKAERPGQVVVHPIALRHIYLGDPHAAIDPILNAIETRLSWQPQRDRSLLERVARVGEGLLSLKEIEYFGKSRTGTLEERLTGLIDWLLRPLEQEWLAGRRAATVLERVKQLRTAILCDMIAGKVTPEERARRWRQLGDIYLAQQLSCYPPDYLTGRVTVERVLETVERFEEDLTDQARIHRPFRVIIEVAPAIPVGPTRERGDEDPLMQELREQLQEMLTRLSKEATPLPGQGASPNTPLPNGAPS